MMRLALLLLVVLLLVGGCGGRRGAGVPANIPPQSLTASFKPGGLADVIVVHAVDWRPLRSAVLVAPDGVRIPPYSLDVTPSPIDRGSLMQQIAPGAQRPVAQTGIMDSTALIRLPDPLAYAKEWRRWRIAVVLGDPGAGRIELTLDAPPSPPI
jgi:hypothetical protein